MGVFLGYGYDYALCKGPEGFATHLQRRCCTAFYSLSRSFTSQARYSSIVVSASEERMVLGVSEVIHVLACFVYGESFFCHLHSTYI